MSGTALEQPRATDVARVGSGIALLTLCSGQFLMMLDTSVMNVSMATVAKDVGTTITGIQTAITLYTLVMAALMVTGGKIGQIIGPKRAFAIGCVIYGAGSGRPRSRRTSRVLLVGWSCLEGIGACLIMPAIVALVAKNFGRANGRAHMGWWPPQPRSRSRWARSSAAPSRATSHGGTSSPARS